MPTGQYIRKPRGKHKEDCFCGSCRKHPEDCNHCLIQKGRIVPDEVGRKISIAKKGKSSNRYGHNQPQGAKEAIRKARLLYFKEHPGIFAGENNPQWQGGKSFEPYSTDWTEKLRESIKVRDNYQCQSCFRHQSELTRILHVHHIDENKKNCSRENLISLCNNCHVKLHSQLRKERKLLVSQIR